MLYMVLFLTSWSHITLWTTLQTKQVFEEHNSYETTLLRNITL